MARVPALLSQVVVVLIMVSAAAPATAGPGAFRVSAGGGPHNVPMLVADGTGGAIAAWTDATGGQARIRAQHLLGAGSVDPTWPADGLVVADASWNQYLAAIVADGHSGAIVIWNDFRGAEPTLFAHRVRAAGTLDPAWPAGGRSVCSAAGGQVSPCVVTDGAGGVIVAWEDQRNGIDADIYANHLTAGGLYDPSWPQGGIRLCGAPGNQTEPVAVSDGAGGAVVAWVDGRRGDETDVYTLHVQSPGTLLGPSDGLALCAADSEQVHLTIAGDDAGGAIVSWEDLRNGLFHEIFAHHVLASGTADPVWPPGGLRISSGTGPESYPRAVSDGVGGAIVAWVSQHVALDMNLRARHVLAAGTLDPAWPADGFAVCSAAGNQKGPAVAGDGGGGALIVWVDQRAPVESLRDLDVLAQHVLAGGVADPTWLGSDGEPVAAEARDQDFPAVVEDDGGGAIVAWAHNHAEIYARHVPPTGLLGVPPTDLAGISSPWPNPARHAAGIRLTLASVAAASVAVYDLGGRRVRSLLRGTFSGGSRVVNWDLTDESNRPVPNGLYFIHAVTKAQQFTRTIVVLR